jgi:glycosyltransferase involved in cell wall biosynthesis
MRIVIDLQGAQNRAGEPGAALALAQDMARQSGGHEIWVLLNAALPGAVALREALAGLLPPERIAVFDIAEPGAEREASNAWRKRVNENVREYSLAQIAPDAVLATQLYGGFDDEAVCSVGAFANGATTAVLLDAMPDEGAADYLARKNASLQRAGLVLCASDAVRDEAIAHLALDAGKVRTVAGEGPSRAQAVLQALATLAPPAPATLPARPKLAFVSPLPPERTGIADYAAQCLPALSALFDIDLIVHQDKVLLPPELDALPRRDLAWFEQNAQRFDQILYQFGNSPFHSHMFALLERFPGVVVLHDFYLSSVLCYEQMTGAVPGMWTDALFHSHGYAAVQAALAPDGQEQARQDYPCNLGVLQGATAVIVHSDHARSLAGEWYGPGAARNYHVVPLPRSAPQALDRAGARAALGIAPDAFVVCTFGFVDKRKQSLRLLEAWLASPMRQDAHCELVFVGANHNDAYGQEMLAAIAKAGCGARIRIAGWTDDAVYHQYLQAADVGVQLRLMSRGETSAAVLDCMNYGLATIINANGSMAELPGHAVWALADDFEDAALVEALASLYQDEARRLALGRAAAEHLASLHRPEHGARLYADVLAATARAAATAMPALLEAIAATPGLPRGTEALRELSQCLALAPQRWPQPRQLLVDVSTIVRNDLGTGIERVVRMQLLELLRAGGSGLRVEPVYLSDHGGRWHYRLARRYACQVLGLPEPVAPDEALDINPGDIFYGPDYAPVDTRRAAEAGIYARWRARGVSVNFLVHDLLPVLRPEFFPEGAAAVHGAWLQCIAQQGDRLVCISQAVADELRGWIGADCPPTPVVHHGADLGPVAHHAADAPMPPAMAQIGMRPTFLMVGTIEPRKGHLQALDAFELLWAAGVEVNLLIVGHEGWKGLSDAERRTIPRITARLAAHKEAGRRLFWLAGAPDAVLEQAYRDSVCLLAASEGEGFGLPLIEAARHGLPVLARDIPVFREVAGEAAAYFDGAGAAALADGVRAWLALRAQDSHPRSTSMAWRTWAENAGALRAVLQAAP